MRTRLFGVLIGVVTVPVASDSSGTYRALRPTLLFPGLRPGERLAATTELPPRAALLATDGTPLAQGPQLSTPIPDVAQRHRRRPGPDPADEAAHYADLGLPPERLGRPRRSGADLRDPAGRNTRRDAAGRHGGCSPACRPAAARALRTTIDPTIERAVVAAIAGRYAGMVAMDPRTGAILAAAGVAFSALQPPGSTMKIVTATGVLANRLAALDDTFPVATEATIDGFALQNANGEACGGTLLNAFAVSCNSVFAPLGVELGARRFLAVAKRFGFNAPSPIAAEPASTIPPQQPEGPPSLELGSSAIGQGKVLATTLQMADVAATIAMGGRRPLPTLVHGAAPQFRPPSPRARSPTRCSR